MIWVIPLALLIIFEALADIFSKEWSVKNHWWMAAAGLACYLVANIFWLFALKNGSGLARGGTIFAVACAVMAVVLGLIVYKEHTSRIQIAGMVLGVISLVLIFWE